jgi:hypothetical protein
VSTTLWLAVTRAAEEENSAMYFVPLEALEVDDKYHQRGGEGGGGGGGDGFGEGGRDRGEGRRDEEDIAVVVDADGTEERPETVSSSGGVGRVWSAELERRGVRMETAPGDLLVWTQHVLHWGSGWQRRSQGGGERGGENDAANDAAPPGGDSSEMGSGGGHADAEGASKGASEGVSEGVAEEGISDGAPRRPGVSISVELQRADAPSSLDRPGLSMPADRVPSFLRRMKLIGVQLLQYQHMLREPLPPKMVTLAEHLATIGM